MESAMGFRLKLLAMVSISILFTSSCATNSKSMRADDFNPKNYNTVTIYDSAEASFIELELAQLFKSIGFKVIGELEVGNYEAGTVLGARYTLRSIGDSSKLVILLEDTSTDKTMLTVEGSASGYTRGNNETYAWELVMEKLQRTLR